MTEAWKKVLTSVEKGQVVAVYLLYGDEDYKIEAALKSLLDALVPEQDRSLNLAMLDGAESTWNEVLEHLRTTSMFGGRKVVAVKDAKLGEGPQKAFEKARNAWSEGGEHKRKRAANIMMGILGEIEWPIEVLSESSHDARNAEEWKSGAKIEIRDDFKWMNDLYEFARAENMAPKKNEDTIKLEEFLKKSDGKDATLILTATAPSKGTKLYKAIDKAGEVVAFESPRNEFQKHTSLKESIDAILDEAGKKIDARAMARLELKTGFDLRRTVGEIRKLIIYIADKKIITEKDVEELVPRTKEESVFELGEAFCTRNSKKALALMGELEAEGHHPLEMLGVVHTQLRNLYLATRYVAALEKKNLWRANMIYPDFMKRVWTAIKPKAEGEGDGEKETGKKKRKTPKDKIARLENAPEPIFPGLHPYVAFNSLKFQANYHAKEFPRAFKILGIVDAMIKRSAGDPLFLLEQAVVAICARKKSFLEMR